MENGTAYTHTFAKRNKKNIRLMVKILIAIFCGSESGLWGANLAPGSCVAYIGPFPFNYDTKNQDKGTVSRVASGQTCMCRTHKGTEISLWCSSLWSWQHPTGETTYHLERLPIFASTIIPKFMLQHRHSNKCLLITPAALPASSVLSEILTTNSFDSTACTDILSDPH